MSKVYIAKQSIGRFKTGEQVEGLTDERAKFLLEKGAIEEADTKADVKADDKPSTKAKTTTKKA